MEDSSSESVSEPEMLDTCGKLQNSAVALTAIAADDLYLILLRHQTLKLSFIYSCLSNRPQLGIEPMPVGFEVQPLFSLTLK